ncbi:hypothetical protein [Streptomyces sp. PSAA01]|uniref:hypothetical protein n=1 Tax=Streptomyces sp. PSAA01 TaxID=2912762 RepID=UPI001F266D63|nr:hypothetical protein [Streptomyces sp. PSAA01]MCG0284576.1 hypothetical protein [Streptomyces sp. PSAA01]
MSAIDLLNPAPGLHDKIKVKMVNGGRQDIPSQAFNDREPLEFDLGARVIAPLENGLSPSGPRGQQWEADGTRLKIWPRLIHHGAEPLSFPVLVDGEHPQLI